MKKGFMKYSLLWLVALAIFNAVAFLTPGPDGADKLTSQFWIAYTFITVAFLAQLFCTALVFKKDLLNKRFCNIPLTAVSVIILLLLTAAGSVLIAIPAIEAWISILVCYLIVIIHYIANITALINYDDKGATAKGFIATLKNTTDAIARKATSEEMKALADEICAAVHSADTFSDAALAGVDDKILKKCEEFSSSVEANDIENAKAQAKQLLSFIKERNAKCRILK